jgi:small subunit ribosomal protein S17
VSETTQTAKKQIRCIVTSDKMDKSRVASIPRLIKHERYGKFIRRSTKLMFHDANNETKIGDEVTVFMSAPHSKRKKFTLSAVVKKATPLD